MTLRSVPKEIFSTVYGHNNCVLFIGEGVKCYNLLFIGKGVKCCNLLFIKWLNVIIFCL